MEEMTEIVTTFYSLEGASKGVALERWDSDVLSNTNKKNLFLNISYFWPQPYLEYFVKIFFSRAEAIFKQLDSNGDGSLDEEEFCK